MTETPPLSPEPVAIPVATGAVPGVDSSPPAQPTESFVTHGLQYAGPQGGGWVLPPGAPVPPGWAPVPGRPGWVVPARPIPPPRPAGVLGTHWIGPIGGAQSAALAAIAAAAVVAAVSLVLTLPGFGWLLTGVAVTVAAVVTAMGRGGTPVAAPPIDGPATVAVAGASETGTDAADGAVDDAAAVDDSAPIAETVGAWALVLRHGERVFWAACALALLSVGTFRAAGWLFFWCVVIALGCGAYALAGGRTAKAMTLAVLAFVGAPVRSMGWFFRGVGESRRARGNGPRVALSIAVTVALLIVFGALFAGADAEFRHLMASVVPTFSGAEVARVIFCFVAVGLLTSGVAFLAAAPPTLGELASLPTNKLRRVEWVLPLAVLNLLFVAFDAVQLAVLFNPDQSLATASHKYMKGYAHSGFWQLLAVTLLTLSVLAVAGRFAPRTERTDRTLFRVLLGGLSVFSLVIVASALKRVAAYEGAYGFTRLRVVVGGIEIWLGVVFLFVLIATLTLRPGWLPRVIAGSFAVALFAGAVANPDGYVANHNVARYEKTGKLSVEYMSQLSADAAPAINTLPPNLAGCAAVHIWQSLDRADGWRTANFARADARVSLAHLRIPRSERGCPHVLR